LAPKHPGGFRPDPPPDPERHVDFLFRIQRLLSDGSFVATYKFALLLSLADLAVERGDDTTESLALDTRDLAERFVALYWRQVLPWVHTGSGTGDGCVAECQAVYRPPGKRDRRPGSVGFRETLLVRERDGLRARGDASFS
jgi:hypothetical protein